jgi:hypothetical protein
MGGGIMSPELSSLIQGACAVFVAVLAWTEFLLKRRITKESKALGSKLTGDAPGRPKGIGLDFPNGVVAWAAVILPVGLIACGISLITWILTPIEEKFGWLGTYWLVIGLVQLALSSWTIWGIIRLLWRKIHLKMLDAKLEISLSEAKTVEIVCKQADVLRVIAESCATLARQQKVDADNLSHVAKILQLTERTDPSDARESA